MAPPLLSLRDAAVRLGAEPLFQDVSIGVGRGDRICLVGRNGSGKSTLLKALGGLIELDAGVRVLKPGATVAALAQDPDLRRFETTRAVVLDGLPPDRSEAAHLADALLARFALDPGRLVATLSGGEVRRAALARTLVAEPEVLLLDEPTNHLDITAIEQLEEDLRGFRGGLVLVSHDRAFLRALSTTTWWLERGRLRVLDQGFAAFDDWSEQVLAGEEAAVAKLEKTIGAEEQWLRRGVTARRRRNQGRLRRLQELRAERAATIGPQGRVRLEATAGARRSQLVIEAEGIGKGYGDRLLIDRFSTRILRGDRIGIVGPNGAGKTTLLRLLTGALEPDHGRVRLADGLIVAYVDQRRQQLDPDATPWSTLCPGGGDQVQVQGRARHIMSYLEDFLFRPEQARSPIRSLSGGERSRLLLARQLAQPCDLMVLDEPTNDLDMDTLDLLQEVLAEFPGTLLLVSHDRDFLDRTVTGIVAFEGRGRLVEYAGGYSDLLRQRPDEPLPPQAPPPRAQLPVRDEPPAAGPRRPHREIERTVARIEALEQEIAAVERALADPELYRRSPAGFAAKTAELERLRAALTASLDRWAELEALLETRR